MTKKNVLEIHDLHVSVEGKEIVKGLTLTIGPGEVHALMGPNGSGKSTLSFALMGHPKYEITKGKIILNGEDVTGMEADERARKGLFLCFQYPSEIAGVTVSSFLRTAVNAIRKERKEKPLSVGEFHALLEKQMEKLHMDKAFASRYLNEGFSGGEKKRAEILQMALLNPSMAVLDETDSGLDIDALRIVSEGINATKSNKMGVLLITHYQRILNYVTPDHIHIMINGRLVKSGGQELVEEIEKKGYDWLKSVAEKQLFTIGGK